MRNYLAFLLPVSFIFLLDIENVLAKFKNCNPKDFAVNYVRAYDLARPIDNVDRAIKTIDTMTLAKCQQAEAIELLKQNLGNKIGYKVAITSKKAQQQTGITNPIVGVLLEKMLLPNGSTIAINSGGKLIYEVDFLVKIKNEDINNAETIMDVARNLEAVYPFIEVPDLMLPEGTKFTGSLIVAMNVGARWGVVGKPIPVRSDREFLRSTGNMRVTMYDESGKLLTEANGNQILGHPFNSVLFLVKELRERGEKLQPGDLVSLGTFGRFHVAKSGKSAIAVYQGISDRPATVLVKFK